jgi:hypothetical protein
VVVRLVYRFLSSEFIQVSVVCEQVYVWLLSEVQPKVRFKLGLTLHKGLLQVSLKGRQD